MGKRSNFERLPRDYYPTPKEGVLPITAHLPEKFTFCEPCAGDGRLISHLEEIGGRCISAYDIEPQGKSDFIEKYDALQLTKDDLDGADYIITNPPWDRKILHPMIEHFRNLCPAWLLFDSDWAHTKQSSEHMKSCAKIVSVGRLKWIEETNWTGKENCSWYLFMPHEVPGTFFYGR